MTAVFISYSRRDKAFVQRLHEALSSRAYDVWVDWEDIPPSAEWFEEIRSGVRGADGFIYVISPDSASSATCARELEHALEQHKRVVPVLHREPNGVPVPEGAAALNWVFLRDDDDFDTGLEMLVDALETDLDHVRVHTRLGVQAARWQDGGRNRSQLLRGSDLNAAEAWLVAGAGKRPEATQLQRAYVLASRRAATRRQRSVIGAVSAALIVALTLAIVALVQRATAVRERNTAYARQLDAEAQAQYATDPELSVLLAIQAARIEPGPVSEATLRTALADSNVRARYPLANKDAGGDVLWSPDGRRVLITSPGGTAGGWARIYTPGTSARPVALPWPSGRGESGWDSAGDRVVIGGGQPGVYDAATGKTLRRLPGTAIQAALTPDGRRAVTVDIHAVGHVFDVASGRSLASFVPHLRGGSDCLALSPNGQYAAQCDAQSLSFGLSPGRADLDVWNLITGRLVRSVHASSLIGTVAFSPDSSRFVITIADPAGGAGTSSVQALERGEGAPGTLVYATQGNGGPVITFPSGAFAATFDPDPRVQVLAWATDGDSLGHLYDFVSHRSLQLTGATAPIETIRFDAQGAVVVLAGRDDVARLYNVTEGGQPMETLAGHTARIVDAGIGADDRYVVTNSDDGTARLWQGPTPIPSLRRADAGGDGGGVLTLGFTQAGDRIVQAGTGRAPSGQGRILDARTLRTVATMSAPAGLLFGGALAARDGRLVTAFLMRRTATGYVGTELESFDARTGARLATMVPAGGHSLVNAALNRLGTRAVTIESGGRAELWDTETGRLTHTLAGVDTPASAAAFSPDGATVAVAHYPALPRQVGFTTTYNPVAVQLWDTSTGHLQRTLLGDRLTSQSAGAAVYAPLAVAFSPSGRLLALSGADPTIEVFDSGTGRQVRRLSIAGLPGGSYADSLAFSPDGRLLAAGAATDAYVWRLPSYEREPAFQHRPAGQGGFVGGGLGVRVAFSDNARILVTEGGNALAAWSLGDRMQALYAYPIGTGNIDPAGTKAVTASGAGISVYPCPLCGGLAQLLRLASQRVTRALTPAERAQYLTQG